MHKTLILLLHEARIHPCSLSSDGTETEQKLQDLIVQAAPSFLDYHIPNSVAGCSVHLKIPLHYRFPSIIVQDSKHGLKTARNQIFSGARMLVLGNFPVHYAQLLDFANHPLGPLFKRDVEHVDRQDD